MREMVWDEELAAKAQQWANQCTFEHDPSRYLGINPLMHNFLYFSLKKTYMQGLYTKPVSISSIGTEDLSV